MCTAPANCSWDELVMDLGCNSSQACFCHNFPPAHHGHELNWSASCLLKVSRTSFSLSCSWHGFFKQGNEGGLVWLKERLQSCSPFKLNQSLLQVKKLNKDQVSSFYFIILPNGRSKAVSELWIMLPLLNPVPHAGNLCLSADSYPTQSSR